MYVLMELKKRIRLIAVGFIFTLININVNTGRMTINIMPDFLGWLIIAIACAKKDENMKNPMYTIGAVILSLCEAALLVYRIVYPKRDIALYTSAISFISLIYVFPLLTRIEKIAKKNGYDKVSSLRILKYLYTITYILTIALGLAQNLLPADLLAILLTICGLIVLAVAVLTIVVLFGMSARI